MIETEIDTRKRCDRLSDLLLTYACGLAGWKGQATVDLLQQAALLHATGPMQVGVGGNRGTGCGQITVRRSVGSMWTRLPLGGFISPPPPPPPPPPTTQNLLQR